MARGTLSSNNSSPWPLSSPAGQFPFERSNMSQVMTPEEKGSPGNLQVLSQVGIVELLEQDDRPTFILDMGNQANFQPGPLHVMFANPALMAYRELYDIICGKAVNESPGLAVTHMFAEFKAWTVSFVKNNESMDVCLPSFLYADITWICSTLRKRFRLISGNPPLTPSSITSIPSPSGPHGQSLSKTVFSNGQGRSEMNSIIAAPEEPTDYFGDIGLPISNGSRSGSSGLIAPYDNSLEPAVRSRMPTTTSRGNNISRLAYDSDDGQRSPLEDYPRDAPSRSVSDVEADRFPGPQLDEQGCFDWTRIPVTSALPRHIQFARSIDWAATSLGPIETWSSALRSMCNLIMASPNPAAMYFGHDYTAIYNEAYIHLAGQKHPRLMGLPYSKAWPEIWDVIEKVFETATKTGQSTMKDDDCLFLNRSGFLEETYFSWSIIPLVGAEGSVVGLYNPAFEKTRRKIAERRMLTLREVGERTAAAREMKSFWSEVLKGLECNEYDTPFVLLYSVSDEYESDMSSMHSNSLLGAKQCTLEGTLPPLPEDHRLAPANIDLRSGTDGFGQIFREAMSANKPVLLETENGALDVSIMEGVEWRGFGEMPRAAVVCPIQPTTGGSEDTIGFLVMGINPRRPYDDDYELFVQLLSRQLATSMASVVLFEEEIRRGQKAARLAALDRIELSEQLAARTLEALESGTKFTRMAEFAPVGMFIANGEGRMQYANEQWWEISRHPREDDSADHWMDSVKDEDLEIVRQWWSNLVDKKIPVTAEFRFKTPWMDRTGNKGDTWVLASAYPEKNEGGGLKSVFGSITNISQQKWAEDFQKRRTDEAVEMKRQQENFIDITSHEIRNPLSAIIQCADEITTSLTDFKFSSSGKGIVPVELLDSNIDAAQTITLCANHQTRIVSDILTLSKLDSALLLITPVDVMPITVAQQALKMFESEFHSADIRMQFVVDESMERLKIDWVKVDPSRLLQILINLTTNAIKFTSSREKRTITLTLSASLERPSQVTKAGVSYIPIRQKERDVTKEPDWGDGEEIFIHFAVQDTGRGLTESEKKVLFLRFSQASPKTHVQYGGSGLGLFISRELVEIQGGEIGVASESGIGSTFAFYIKARRSPGPEQSSEPRQVSGSMRQYSWDIARPSAKLDQRSEMVVPSRALSDHVLKVMIVEDNLVNQSESCPWNQVSWEGRTDESTEVLKKQLLKLGCIVYVANHGGECIDQLKQSQFWAGREQDGLELSVILMDQEMPVMDGLTCAKKIRGLQQSGEVVRHVPVSQEHPLMLPAFLGSATHVCCRSLL